jgi:nicotinamide-nucleotide amidase
MPTAEIITIGTELLLGETTDTNTRFIAQVLRGLGVDLFRTQTIGDNAGRIAESIREATGRANIVICTGGLGPTVDDPTRQAIAEAVGKELEFHPELWEQIIERIARYGRKPTMNQKRQAFIPKGAIIIENPVGTAPAFIVETVSGSVISLPGVPREMETLLTDKVIPYLQEKYNLHSIIKLRTLHVSGLGEGVIDDKVGDLETLANPTVGLTAHSGVVDVRIAAKAGTEIEADQMIAGLEKEIRKRLNENIFGADYDTIESVTIEAVTQHGWNLASFEYKTEGVLKSRLAQIGNPTFLGGELLLVSPENLLARAEEIRTRLAASVVLGIAFSDGSDSQGLDLIWVTPMGHEERRLTYGGHPGNARRWAVNMALDGLRRAVGRVTK